MIALGCRGILMRCVVHQPSIQMENFGAFIIKGEIWLIYRRVSSAINLLSINLSLSLLLTRA